MAQPKTVIMTTADPINANVPDGVFIMTAGLTRRRPIIKLKLRNADKIVAKQLKELERISLDSRGATGPWLP